MLTIMLTIKASVQGKFHSSVRSVSTLVFHDRRAEEPSKAKPDSSSSSFQELERYLGG